MTELSFSKSFLALLDSRPQKRPGDYVLPATDLDITAPYTLPRMPTPMRKPTPASGASTGTAADATSPGGPKQTVTIHLKSSRPGPPHLSLTLPGVVASTTSILDLKQQIASHVGLGPKAGSSGGAGAGGGWEKVKVLFARKPVADAKTVKEVLGGDEGIAELYDKRQKAGGGEGGGEVEVEFGVMVMGGGAGGAAAGAADGEKAAAGDAIGAGTVPDDVLAGEQFWADLKGFLMQRLKDEEQAGNMLEVFRTAWKAR